jgi:formylglycine-generating enzyme required for sulfatase activity
MRLIPGGTFMMGTDPDELETLRLLMALETTRPFEPEVPRHERVVQAFYLDETDVTNAAFAEFVSAVPAWARDVVPEGDQNGRYLAHWGDDGRSDASQADHPVTFVTWYAAASYCAWAGKRLPTEAEWEYASGAAIDDRQYPWGDDPPTAALVNWSGSGIDGTVPVASYPPNPPGLYDMSGNVWKFLADAWSDSYAAAPGSALGVDEAVAARDRTRRVVRGGSSGANAANLRVRYRDSHRPWDAREMVGFRCARDADVGHGDGEESVN